MAMKNYSVRLDEEEYEKLRKYLSEYGDPELNISFMFRQYIRDINNAIPDLKKSELGIRSNLSFWGSALKQIARTAQLENILSGDKKILETIRKEKK